MKETNSNHEQTQSNGKVPPEKLGISKPGLICLVAAVALLVVVAVVTRANFNYTLKVPLPEPTETIEPTLRPAEVDELDVEQAFDDFRSSIDEMFDTLDAEIAQASDRLTTYADRVQAREAIMDQAYADYMAEEWDGSLREVDGHIVSIDHIGRLWCDCYTDYLGPGNIGAEHYKRAFPWSNEVIIGQKSTATDIVSIARDYQSIKYYHYGQLVREIGYDRVANLTEEGEEVVFDSSWVQEDGGKLYFDDLTKERISIIRETLRLTTWDGEFRQFPDGFYARVNSRDGTVYINNEKAGNVCLPDFKMKIYRLRDTAIPTTPYGDPLFHAAVYVEDNTLYVYTLDPEPLICKLPTGGEYQIVNAKIAYGKWSENDPESSRLFTVIVEVTMDADVNLLYHVYGNLDTLDYDVDLLHL